MMVKIVLDVPVIVATASASLPSAMPSEFDRLPLQKPRRAISHSRTLIPSLSL